MIVVHDGRYRYASIRWHRCGLFKQVKLALIFAFLTTSCHPSSYFGISLKPGTEKPDVQELARRARSGNKKAQFDLAVRFEEGHGVSKRADFARKLYSSAETASGGDTMLFVPGFEGTKGAAVPFFSGHRSDGVREDSHQFDLSQADNQSKIYGTDKKRPHSYDTASDISPASLSIVWLKFSRGRSRPCYDMSFSHMVCAKNKEIIEHSPEKLGVFTAVQPTSVNFDGSIICRSPVCEYKTEFKNKKRRYLFGGFIAEKKSFDAGIVLKNDKKIGFLLNRIDTRYFFDRKNYYDFFIIGSPVETPELFRGQIENEMLLYFHNRRG